MNQQPTRTGCASIVATRIIALLLIFTLSGCAGQRTSSSPVPAAENDNGANVSEQQKLHPAQAELPALPVLDQLHLASALQDLVQDGAGATQLSSGAVASGDTCLIDATAAGPNGGSQAEWAVYGFYAGGELDILGLDLELDVPGDSKCWIALSNFAKGTWEWHGAFDSGDAFDTISLPTGNGTDYLSSASKLYCAVLCDKGSLASVEGLSLHLDITGNVPPNAILTPESVTGEAPYFAELDASQSDAGGDIGDSIVLYEWDLDGDGNIDLAGPEASQSFNFSAGAWTITVFVSDSTGQKASDSCEMNISTGGVPPVAALEADTYSGEFPLTVNFDASASNGGLDGDQIILYEWDWDGRGAYDEDSASDSTFSHTFTSAGQFGTKVRVTDAGGNQATAQVTISVFDPSNAPPAAVLTPIEAHKAAPPFTVYLDASASNAGGDSGDSIVKYEWDRNGDNIFELDSGTDPDIFHTFSTPWRGFVRVRVTDGANNQSEASCKVNVGTGPVTVTSSGTPSTYTSLAMVNNTPAIAYYESTGKDLCFVHANDPLGASWGAVQVLDSNGRTGLYCDLKVINGNPCIAYYNDTDDNLMFIRALDFNGSSWDAPLDLPELVDADEGQFCSLAQVDGRAAIAYTSVSNGVRELRYKRAIDPLGEDWPDTARLINESAPIDGGQYCSLAIVNGRPAVAYTESSFTQLYYTRAEDSKGVQWGDRILLDTGGNEFIGLGDIVLIDKLNSRPSVSYRYLGHLRVINATSPNGSTWAAPLVLDAGDSLGWDSGMALINGIPMVCYYDADNDNLKLVRSKISDATNWNAPELLDFSGDIGTGCSIAADIYDEQPGIAYLDYSAGSLNYIWAP